MSESNITKTVNSLQDFLHALQDEKFSTLDNFVLKMKGDTRVIAFLIQYADLLCVIIFNTQGEVHAVHTFTACRATEFLIKDIEQLLIEYLPEE